MAVSVDKILRWKQTGAPAQPLAVLTAWDVMSAQIVDAAGADIV